MQNQIVLSICIPTYNRKDILKETLDEIFFYEKNDIDVIVIDNASTDGTREMLDNYKEERLIVKHNVVDKGMFENQLEALFSGNGKYTLLLMDRDRIFSTGIYELITFLNRVDIEIIHIDSNVKEYKYEKEGRAISYGVIRTHPSQLIYKTNDLKRLCDKKRLMHIIKSDKDYSYSYPEIIALLLLNQSHKICLYPSYNLLRLEVVRVKSYTRYKMKLKNVYYMPEGAKRRYLKCVEEIMTVYGNRIVEYLPYIFASELYWGTKLHYFNSSDREFSHKYNIKKISFYEYFGFEMNFYKSAIMQLKKLKIFRIKTMLIMTYIMTLYLFEMYVLLKIPSKRIWTKKIDNYLKQWCCAMY